MVSEHVKAARLKFDLCVCSGEGVVRGVVVALAVKFILQMTPKAAACVQQEIEALRAVLGKKHIVQYVDHAFTDDRSFAFLTTRWIRAVPLAQHASQVWQFNLSVKVPLQCHLVVLCKYPAADSPGQASIEGHRFNPMPSRVFFPSTLSDQCAGIPFGVLERRCILCLSVLPWTLTAAVY